MDWFRFYTEVVHDPKVQRLSGELFKSWVNLLCLAGLNDGVLPPADDIAYHFHTSEERVKKTLESLMDSKCCLLDSTERGIVPHNWDGRQFRSDHSTERVRRFRNGKRPLRKRDETVSETAPEQNRTDTEQKQSRTDWRDRFEPWMYGLINRHPKKAGNGDSPRQLMEYLESAMDPDREMEIIDSRHQEYCTFWAARREQDGIDAPQLDSWVLKKGWLDPPPPLKSTKSGPKSLAEVMRGRKL